MEKSVSHYFKNRSGLNLHYLTWGAKDKPAILLLHGLRSYASTWQPLAPLLAEHFYLIALDQRGRGQSDWAPDFNSYHTPYYVQDIEDLVQQEKLSSLIIIGHSLGGTNALEYTRLHPQQVKALVIEDIGPGSSIQGDGAERIRREMKSTPLSFNTWDEAKAFWQKLRPLIDEQGIASRLQHTLIEKDGQIVWRHDQQGIAQARLTIPSIDLWPAVEQLKCPTLFIKGALSDFLSQDTLNEMRHRNPDLQCIEVTDASHYVHDDQTQMFNRMVYKFLINLVSE